MLTKYPMALGGFTTFEADKGGGSGGNPTAAADPAGDPPAGGDDPVNADPADPGKGDEGKFDAERAKAALNKKNSENANLRKRLKELEPLAEEAKQLKEASRSESEKLTDAKTTAEKDAASAKAEAARLRVALKKGLTEVQAKRLIGETEEELEADADELLASFKKDDDPKSGDDPKDDPKRVPKEKTTPGSVPEVNPEEETDPRKLAEGLPSYS
jgi:hypothetical protein